MQEEKIRLEQEAQALTQRMEDLMHDNFQRVPIQFDAETPIDKVLNVMQAFITQVSCFCSLGLLCIRFCNAGFACACDCQMPCKSLVRIVYMLCLSEGL